MRVSHISFIIDHMKDERDFPSEISRFLKETGMAPTTFGREAMGNSNFLRDMEAQNWECLPRTQRRVRSFMTGYRLALKKAQAA